VSENKLPAASSTASTSSSSMQRPSLIIRWILAACTAGSSRANPEGKKSK